jgi:hypothetical protein
MNGSQLTSPFGAKVKFTSVLSPPISINPINSINGDFQCLFMITSSVRTIIDMIPILMTSPMTRAISMADINVLAVLMMKDIGLGKQESGAFISILMNYPIAKQER